MPTVTVVILTGNEERHIARAIGSISGIGGKVVVVDGGSTDRTVEIAMELDAHVLSNPFVTQAQQFNWAMARLPPDSDWIFRLDADEVLSSELSASIRRFLDDPPQGIAGLTVSRRISFLGRPIRFGGIFPVYVLRMFRHKLGRCEDRWMDEHIVVDGNIGSLEGELLDDNLNSLGWWIDKHNRYASREALQVLLDERAGDATDDRRAAGRQAGAKRWIKRHVYSQLPGGLRAFLYFFYRYLLRGGFRDGFPGLAFHVLQGFWYRFLVDAKLYEARRSLTQNGGNLAATCRETLGIYLDQ